MKINPTIQSSQSVFIQINPTGITANLVPLGTSMITSGYEQDLYFNPGNYSYDPDGFPFNSSDWIYKYYCRIYGYHNDFIINSLNDSSDLSSCLINQTKYEFDERRFPKESSIRILRESLELNKTYQFMVQMNNRRNSSIYAIGYVLVQIKDLQRPMIIIGCVISTLCSSNLEYQRINPTTQVALYSYCYGKCPLNEIIQWNIYYQSKNSTQWILFPEMNFYEKKWFFVLYSLSTKIPYEDIQITGQQLLQCAANVLTGVNSVLQERTNVLKSDFDSSIKTPDDYDTDLESDWSNLKLFVDENHFSMEIINNNRNEYYQKKLTKQITNEVNQIITLVTNSLNIHLNIDQKFEINTEEIFVLLETISISSIFNKKLKQIGGVEIDFPSNFISSLNNNSIISLRSTIERLAIFEKNSNTNLSRMISLSLLDRNGNEISVETTKQYRIRLIIPRDPNHIISPMIYYNISSFNSTRHNQTFHYHFINITSQLPISIHIEFQSLNLNLSYLLIYKFDQIPQLNNSIDQIDGWDLFCPSNETHIHFIDNQRTIGHQTLIFGLRELNSNDLCLNSSNKTFFIPNESFEFTSDYQLRIFTSGCYYLNEHNQWKSDGLIVGSNTTHYQTECFSTHLTKFASGYLILPEMIDWKFVLANAEFYQNKTIYLTVITVTTIYIILMIYARKKDKKDLEKLGVTPLSDNQSSDHYYYQLIVFTGQRKDSGTTSKVHFVLYGDKNITRIRTFSDSQRKIFQRGGIDSFIMSVPKSLGLLNCLRIWHDNSGEDSLASWFLKYIIVRDLQTMETFHFISQRWFAVEKEDGKIERVFPVANEEEKKEFTYILSKKAFHSLSDGHLWFSIFSRPPSNQFTRVQRCTSCFVLLFVSMLSNIMYYDLSNEAKVKTSTNLSFGSFSITSDQILVGLISELISLIPSLLLIQMFRRLRSRHQRISPLEKVIPHYSLSNKNVTKKKKKKCSITFPWWFIFIIYGLSFLSIIVSIFLIIARGIEFGDIKSQQWLISVLSSFFSSILLTEPIKILSLTIFFAVFCQKSTNEDEEAKEYFDENQLILNNDEEYLHSSIEVSTIRPNRLTPNEIAYARQIRLRELQIWSIIREIFIYISFVALLSAIVYSNRNENASFQVQHLRKSFHQPKILSINEYWNWLEKDFVRNLRAQKWYNGKNVEYLRGYMNDTSNRIIGWALMKQFRIRAQICPKRMKVNSICRNDLSGSNEERRSFSPGWFDQSKERFSPSISQSFLYRTSEKGYIYEYRGSLSDLRNNLSQLHRLGWIDQQTRLIQIQMSLYNPNIQLFTFVTLQNQFLSTGSIHFQSRFEPIQLSAFTSLFQMICIILYLILILYFLWNELQTIYELKWKYLFQFWSIIELGLIICSFSSIGVYFSRYKTAKEIAKVFRESQGDLYINLQSSAYLNDLLTYFNGFCCFFGTIKFLRLCRFNRRLSLFSETLRLSMKELISFSMMFSIIFVSFLCLFYLLFLSKLSSCSTLFQTSQMLFEMILLKFDSNQLSRAGSFLGPFTLTLFIVIVVFICLSIFLSIINENFRLARQQSNEDPEVFLLILNKFLRWTGLRKRPEWKLQEERDKQMRGEYLHIMNALPLRTKQLVNQINRMYFDR
ncbi:hypothetical protein I4U23_022512 [Adineta vaga]|nr:hypothetical protein I4U23_022512 [Adineta vaga]